MKTAIFTTLLCAAVLIPCGCRCAEAQTGKCQPAKCAPAAACAKNQKLPPEVVLGNEILTAIQNNNFEKFTAFLNGGLGDKMSKKDFETSRGNIESAFGKITGFTFLVSLETPEVDNTIWKVSFERKGKDGKTIRQDLLFRLISAVSGDKRIVLSLGFM